MYKRPKTAVPSSYYHIHSEHGKQKLTRPTSPAWNKHKYEEISTNANANSPSIHLSEEILLKRLEWIDRELNNKTKQLKERIASEEYGKNDKDEKDIDEKQNIFCKNLNLSNQSNTSKQRNSSSRDGYSKSLNLELVQNPSDTSISETLSKVELELKSILREREALQKKLTNNSNTTISQNGIYMTTPPTNEKIDVPPQGDSNTYNHENGISNKVKGLQTEELRYHLKRLQYDIKGMEFEKKTLCETVRKLEQHIKELNEEKSVTEDRFSELRSEMEKKIQVMKEKASEMELKLKNNEGIISKVTEERDMAWKSQQMANAELEQMKYLVDSLRSEITNIKNNSKHNEHLMMSKEKEIESMKNLLEGKNKQLEESNHKLQDQMKTEFQSQIEKLEKENIELLRQCEQQKAQAEHLAQKLRNAEKSAKKYFKDVQDLNQELKTLQKNTPVMTGQNNDQNPIINELRRALAIRDIQTTLCFENIQKFKEHIVKTYQIIEEMRGIELSLYSILARKEKNNNSNSILKKHKETLERFSLEYSKIHQIVSFLHDLEKNEKFSRDISLQIEGKYKNDVGVKQQIFELPVVPENCSSNTSSPSRTLTLESIEQAVKIEKMNSTAKQMEQREREVKDRLQSVKYVNKILQKEVHSKQAELDRLRSSADNHVQEIMTELRNIKQQLSQKEGEYNSLISKFNKSQSDLNICSQRICNFVEEIENLESKISERDSVIREMKELSNERESEIEQLRVQLSDERERCKNYISDREKIEALRSEENMLLKSKISMNRKELERKGEECRKYKTEITNLLHDIESKRIVLEELKNALDREKFDRQQLQSRLIKDLKIKDEELANVRQKYHDEVQTLLKLHTKEVEEAERKLAEMRHEIDETTKARDTANDDINRRDIALLQSKCKKLNENMKKLDQKIEKKDDQLSKKQEEIEKLRCDVNEKQEEIEKLKDDVRKLEDLIFTKSQSSNELQAKCSMEFEDIRKGYESESKELKGKIEKNESKIQELEQKLRTQLDETSNALESQKKKYEQKIERIGELHRLEIDHLNQLRIDEKEKLAKLESESSLISQNNKKILQQQSNEFDRKLKLNIDSYQEIINELEKKIEENNIVISKLREEMASKRDDLVIQENKFIEEINSIQESNQRKLKDIEEIIKEKNNKLQMMQEVLNNHQNLMSNLTQQVRTEYEKKTSSMEKIHSRKIASLEEELEEERKKVTNLEERIKKIEREKDERFNAQRKSHELELNEIKSSYNKDIERLNIMLGEEGKKCRSLEINKLEEQKQHYEKEIQDIQRKHESQLYSCENSLKEERCKVETLEQKIQDILYENARLLKAASTISEEDAVEEDRVSASDSKTQILSMSSINQSQIVDESLEIQQDEKNIEEHEHSLHNSSIVNQSEISELDKTTEEESILSQ